jgi:pilus assembly protein CpaE
VSSATRNLCVHGLTQVDVERLHGYRSTASTSTKAELINALRTFRIDALVLSLDEPGAVELLGAAREIRPDMGIVGLTAAADFEVIVAAQRARCDQITSLPIDYDDLNDALHRATTHALVPQTGTTVALLGALGGAGVTTLACHLAVELAGRTRLAVGLVDLDLDFGSVARCFDLRPTNTLADVCRSETIDSGIVEQAAVALPNGVRVLACPATLQEVRELDEAHLRATVDAIATTYPYLVIDLPRRLDSVTGHVLERCNKLLMVLQLTIPSVDNARRLLDALRSEGFPLEKFEYVVNRFRKAVHGFSMEELERQLGKRAFGVVPSDYQAVRLAQDTGQPLSERSPVRAAIASIAANVTTAEPAESLPAAQPNRWLGSWGRGTRKLALR